VARLAFKPASSIFLGRRVEFCATRRSLPFWRPTGLLPDLARLRRYERPANNGGYAFAFVLAQFPRSTSGYKFWKPLGVEKKSTTITFLEVDYPTLQAKGNL